jgi:hypothetical protein
MTDTPDTVKLSISIHIDTEDDAADTGFTLAQWNAMTDHERSEIVSDMWMTMAGDHDNGGIKIVTDGAKEC